MALAGARPRFRQLQVPMSRDQRAQSSAQGRSGLPARELVARAFLPGRLGERTTGPWSHRRADLAGRTSSVTRGSRVSPPGVESELAVARLSD
jgi:hypothetical protein